VPNTVNKPPVNTVTHKINTRKLAKCGAIEGTRDNEKNSAQPSMVDKRAMNEAKVAIFKATKSIVDFIANKIGDMCCV